MPFPIIFCSLSSMAKWHQLSGNISIVQFERKEHYLSEPLP